MVNRTQQIAVVAILVCLVTPGTWAQPFEEIGDVAFFEGAYFGGRIAFIAPVSSTRIFAASKKGGVWRTLDGGVTWETRTDGFRSLRITALAASSTNGRVFAATFAPTRLLRSLDGGDSFTEIVVPQVAFLQDVILELAIDPVHTGTLYAVTSRGLLKSVNDGDDWVVVLPPTSRFPNDVEILAGAEFHVLVTRANEIYRSPSGDAGTFVQIPLPAPPDGQPAYFLAYASLPLAPVPGNPQQVWATHTDPDSAVYLSTDYGATFSFVGRHDQRAFRERFAASADGTAFYTGNPNKPLPRMFRHEDNGQTTLLVEGPYHADVRSISTDLPPYVYVGTDGGLSRFQEPDLWTNLNGDMKNLFVYQARTARSDRNAIIAGTHDNGVIVYRGREWIAVEGGDAYDGMLRTDDPGLGAAFGFLPERFLEVDGTRGGQRTYGFTPPACPPPNNGRFAMDPTDPGFVCIASGKIYCSRDARHEAWCEETADLGFSELVIIDGNFAWAQTTGNRVMRTTTGVLGAWVDVTGDLPAGTLIGIDAPERGDPLRALVLWRPTGDVARVYETTDGGMSWAVRGTAPIADEGEAFTECAGPPCPDTPEHSLPATTFAATFPGAQITESWFVGTGAGLLESTDMGATWVSTNVPNVRISDIETFGHNVTVATLGRGVFRRIAEPVLPEVESVPVGPSWWMRHMPFDIEDMWASDAIEELPGLISEMRRLGQGGRRYRAADVPNGSQDFLLTPGQPVFVLGEDVASLTLDGPPAGALPIALQPGWNPVGLVDAALQTPDGLAADAAAQGIEIGAVLDGGMVQSWVANQQAVESGQGFVLNRTEGYWVYACGNGGLWTPGASMLPQTAPSSTSTTPSTNAGSNACGGLDAALDRLGADLRQRMPGQFFACLPQQEIVDGNDTFMICDSVPSIDSDQEYHHIACIDEPLAHGCAVNVTIVAIEQPAQDQLTVTFDISARGTAEDAQGTPCLVNANAEALLLDVLLDVTVAPPVIDIDPLQFTAQLGQVLQQDCGASVDALLAQLVGDAALTALEDRVTLALNGLGPVCLPDFALPDGDNDGTFDCDDGCPSDPLKVDPGECGCGVVDDVDGDLVSFCAGDCDDLDPNIWALPGETGTLSLDHDPMTGETGLSWSPPAEPGSTSVLYDVLTTNTAGGFAQGAQCVETGGVDTVAVFADAVPPQSVAFFLVRATNGCPGGLGALGTDSSGFPRNAGPCP